MKLRNANENFVVPPIGRYKVKIVATEATLAKTSGAPMIKLTGEIREPADYAGAQFFDNMITDESFKGSGFGKKKLRGLGVPVDSEVEIQDSQIATNLLGLECWADLDHEQINDQGPSGEYDQPRFNMENGRRVPAMKLVPKGYYTHNVQTAPTAPTAPGQTQQNWGPQGGGVPQNFAPPVQQGVPQGYPAPGAFPGFPAAPVAQAPAPVQAQYQQPYQPPYQQAPNGAPPAQPLPWAQPPQAQQTAPQAEAGGGGRGRKKA